MPVPVVKIRPVGMGMNQDLVAVLMSVPNPGGKSLVDMVVVPVVVPMSVNVLSRLVSVLVLVAFRLHQIQGQNHQAPGKQLMEQDGFPKENPG